MRIIISITLTFFLMGATYLYSSFAEGIRPEPVELKVEMDQGQWKILIDRTFDCIPDSEMGTDAISIQLKGSDLYRNHEAVKANDVLEIVDVTGIEQGANEIFIEAYFASSSNFDFDDDGQQHAMRVRIYRGIQLIADRSFWSEPGDLNFMASLAFEAPAMQKPSDQHQH